MIAAKTRDGNGNGHRFEGRLVKDVSKARDISQSRRLKASARILELMVNQRRRAEAKGPTEKANRMLAKTTKPP
jgi:hypothetical protein